MITRDDSKQLGEQLIEQIDYYFGWNMPSAAYQVLGEAREALDDGCLLPEHFQKIKIHHYIRCDMAANGYSLLEEPTW